MFSLKSIVLIAAAFTISAECSAPLVAPAHIGYAHAVPQNVPPYASQVSVVNKAISPYIAAPVAAPLAAPVAAQYFAAPYAAQFAAPIGPLAARVAPAVATPFAAAPYVAAPYAAAPYALPGPFAPSAAYAAPYPYAAGAPLIRGAFGVAPAFVR
ncbi:calphotin-like isoform X1 [Maniola jurtina]|uniref:calphotin-like isoform X1 n=1 Tax=Maniola jurtina TaxID=191418 RepID=UPI001E68B124|nr:calphotin-like isoform X1 [Maniola jurtina]